MTSSKKDMSRMAFEPLVGFRGIGSRVSTQNDAQGLAVRQSVWSQMAPIGIGAIFGPGLTILLWLRPEEFSKDGPAVLDIERVVTALKEAIGGLAAS